VKALSGEGVVADCSREEVAVRDAMLKNAARKVLLCDSSKFGLRAPFRQCGLEDVDILISEEDRAQRFAAYGDRVRLL
jgi:DeoR family glycerol-3-phosphate regulon repressor